MNKEIGLSLRELLELEPFSKTKVVGGHKGLEKTVVNVNVMEVPDILDWIKPGELLLTTAYSIRDNVTAQQNLVPQLAQRGLVGLAIKPRRYIERIPEIMIEQADQYDFPLLELPGEVSFSDLINHALTAIVDKQNNYLNRSLNAHRLFMDIVLNGGGLKDMAKSLAHIIENTVIIYDAKHERMAWETVNWDESKIGDLWDKERAGAVRGQAQTSKVPVEADGCKFFNLEVPIYSGNEFYGKVIVSETNKPLSFPDIPIVERLATVAALEIVNQHALIQIERRYANEFLDLLLFSQIEEESEFINRGRFFGWDLSKPYAAVILQYEKDFAKTGSESEKKRQDMNNRIFKVVCDYYKDKDRAVIAGTKGNMVILLLEVKEREPKLLYKEVMEEARLMRKALSHLLREGDLTISMGRYYGGIAGIQKSYKEAFKALRIGKQIGCQGQNINFHDLGIYRLLVLIDKREELEDFLNETVKPLIKYDADRNSDLVKTLDMFFRCHGNAKKVSDKLFTHYNTVLYRLERIQEITGLDLNDPEDRFNLEVGLKVCKLMQTKV